MWTVRSPDIYRFRGPGGDDFTELMDAAIRAHAYVCGAPASAIVTNAQSNLGDEGVDTEVRQAIPRDRTGWFDVPTCWQYKATGAKGVRITHLLEEDRNRYARRLISQGYGYRLCVCDNIAAPTRRRWEQVLDEEAKRVNSSAPPPRVLTADDIAGWLSGLPGIVTRFFRPELADVWHLRSWGEDTTHVTAEYVEVEEWLPIKMRVLEHADLSKGCREVVFSLQGEAGVGKTRLVYETLAGISGAADLVLYTRDETLAERVARLLTNDRGARAILVADECSLRTRYELNAALAGHTSRVRVIAIDNAGERFGRDPDEIWLSQMPGEAVEAILQANFSDVPVDRRRSYAELAGGFVRFAADLCQQDAQIAVRGDLGPGLPGIRTYLRRRLGAEELRVVEAMSLVWRFGFRGEIGGEFEQLCDLLELPRGRTREMVTRLKDAPGFVALGRYCYITPRIIAQVAFQGAWNHWIAPDAEGFLSRLPTPLVEPFLRRVKEHGDEDARRVVGDFFRAWLRDLTSSHLTDNTTVDRLRFLVETRPEVYLPLLRRLIEGSSREELQRVTGKGDGRWGPRRTLVWLAEGLASFPEFFRDAEAILYSLALAESEPGIANNATGIWQRLFCILLSGTAVPFADRAQILRERLRTAHASGVMLVLGALEQSFHLPMSRVLGPPVVAGRIPPRDWRPSSEGKLKECLASSLDLVAWVARDDLAGQQLRAIETAVDAIRLLLGHGLLPPLRDFLVPRGLPDRILPRLIEEIENFLRYDLTDDRGRPTVTSEYANDVREWYRSLMPGDFHGRLVTAVGTERWHHLGEDDERAWLQTIAELARALSADQGLLETELPWLCSREARSATILGDHLGRRDAEAACLDLIMRSGVKEDATGLARGYLSGLLQAFPKHAESVNRWLDHLQSEAARVAYELFMGIGSPAHAVERALRLIDAGTLPPEYLRGFLYEAGSGALTPGEFAALLKRLTKPIKGGSKSAAEAALELIGAWSRGAIADPECRNPDLQRLIWQILETTVESGERAAPYWRDALEHMAVEDVDRAVRIACRGLVGDRFMLRKQAERVLVIFSGTAPEVVMRRLGEIMVDRRRGWRFAVGRYRDIVQSLPLEVVRTWLGSAGVVGARAIARHLPPPYLDERGHPVVPALTEYILSNYREDRQTFEAFRTGVHDLEVYWGGAAKHDKDAEVARHFLDHPNPTIREWAALEAESAEQQAEAHREWEEELKVDG